MRMTCFFCTFAVYFDFQYDTNKNHQEEGDCGSVQSEANGTHASDFREVCITYSYWCLSGRLAGGGTETFRTVFQPRITQYNPIHNY